MARWDCGVHRLHGLGRDRCAGCAAHRPTHHSGRRVDCRLHRVGTDGARCTELHAVVCRGNGVPHGHGSVGDRHHTHWRRDTPDHGRNQAGNRHARRDAGSLVDARRYGLSVVRCDERSARATRPAPGAGCRGRRQHACILRRPGRGRAVSLQRDRGGDLGRASDRGRQRRARKSLCEHRERLDRGGRSGTGQFA